MKEREGPDKHGRKKESLKKKKKREPGISSQKCHIFEYYMKTTEEDTV